MTKYKAEIQIFDGKPVVKVNQKVIPKHDLNFVANCQGKSNWKEWLKSLYPKLNRNTNAKFKTDIDLPEIK